jgi:hypothetical protein
MKKVMMLTLVVSGLVVAGALLGESPLEGRSKPLVFTAPSIQKALSGATTTQPTDIYPDDGNPTFPIPQVYKSGYANEGRPTSLFASGRPLLITAGTTSGSTSLYSNGSSSPLVTEWGVTSGDSSTSSTNPVTFYSVENSFENYVPPSGTSGCSYFGGKMPVSCTASNVLTGDISIRMTGGEANWLVCGGGSKTTGKGVMELEGGSAKEAMGDWGNSNTDKGVSKGVTINIRNDYSITYLAGSASGYSAVDINLYDSPYVQRTYLSTVNNKRLNVGNTLSAKSKIGLLSPSQGFSASSDSTAITEGTQLVYAADESYLANYKAIFSMFTMTTSSGTAVGYTGTKGEIVKSGNYLIYTYPATRVSAPTPTSSYSKGVISGLTAGETYLLTDSAKTVHTFVADSNGQILVDKTHNTELIDKTISSVVQVRNDSQTDDSAAQSITYAMPATLATPAITYADETLSGLVSGYDYDFTFSDGTSASITSSDHSTTLSVLGQAAFYGKTITGVVRKSSNGDEIDSLSESVSIAVPGRYGTPDSTFVEGIVGSLKASSSYQLTYTDSTGTSHTKSISTTSDGTYLTYKDTDLTGMTITGIALTGDASGLTSLPDTVSYKVPSQFAIVSPSYDTTNHVLSGLSASSTYIVTDSTGATHEISTGDTMSISLAEHPELAGLTIVSVQQKGDGKTTITSDKQSSSLDYVMPTHRQDDGSLASLVSTSYDQPSDTLTGLTAATRYVVTDEEGKSTIITSDANGKVDLSTYAELVGKTITSIALKGTNVDGDNTDYCDSLSVTTSYKVLPHAKIGTPVFDSSTLALTGLTPDTSYAFTANDGKTYTGKSNASGRLELGDLVDASGTSIPGGSVLASLKALGDLKATIDSSTESLPSTITLPLREKTPESTYDQSEGLVQGLLPKTAYRFTYVSTSGSVASIDVTTNAQGEIAVLDYPALDQTTISGIQKKAVDATTLISAPEKTSYAVGLERDVLARIHTRMKSALTQAIADKIAASSVSDPNAVTAKMKSIIESYENQIETMPYTTYDANEEGFAGILSQANAECDYEIARESAKEVVRDLKRTCADDARVNAVIEKAEKKIDSLRFGQDPVSSMSGIIEETKAEVKLTTVKENAENSMAGDDPTSITSYTGEEKDLYDSYCAKIDAATSESEVQSLLSQYQNERTTLLAKEAAATQFHYSIFAYVVLGIYVVFFALYFFVFRQHKFNGIYLIAWLAETILLLVVSLLIKGNNPLALSLLWVFFLLSVALTLFPKKDKEAKTEEGEKHA